jgi:hypothetical protein
VRRLTKQSRILCPVEPVFGFKEAATSIVEKLELLTVMKATESFGDVCPDRVPGPCQLPTDDLTREWVPPHNLPPDAIGHRLGNLQHP